MISPRTNALDVVVAGLAVVDIIGRPVGLRNFPRTGSIRLLESVTMVLGGNACNVGIDLAKLGLRVGVITRLGDDALGAFALREFTRHHITTECVTLDPRCQTSATMVCVDSEGERTFLHSRGSMRHFSKKDILGGLSLIRRAAILSFGYLGLLPELEPHLGRIFRKIKQETSARIALDTGGMPRRMRQEELRRFLPFVDYFIPSYEEAAAITGVKRPEEMTRIFFHAGAAGVVGIKLGAKGSFIAEKGKSAYIRPVPVRHVVDTTGAGDAFMAGFLAATLKGYDSFRSARIANRVAAGCLRAVGASTAVRHFRTYVK
jgi:sugar/nucleoside kinase (ribokinase family)